MNDRPEKGRGAAAAGPGGAAVLGVRSADGVGVDDSGDVEGLASWVELALILAATACLLFALAGVALS